MKIRLVTSHLIKPMIRNSSAKFSKLLYVLILFLLSNQILAQKYKSDESEITFFSEAPLEDISAYNNESSSIIDMESMKMAFSVPINQFQFKKSLMQKHFNEKYMESEKFPKATFSGKIVNYRPKVGETQVEAEGDLTIHGVTRAVTLPGTIDYSTDGISINSTFLVKLEDHDIEIPSIMWKNIAEEIEVKINFSYKPYEID